MSWYIKAIDKIYTKQINFLTDDIRAVLINSSLYTADLTNHEFQSSIPDTAIFAEKALSNKTFSGGVFNADSLVFPNVATSTNQINAIVLIKNTGAKNTSPLLYLWTSATGLPITPDGTDITINWDTGTNKIFKVV